MRISCCYCICWVGILWERPDLDFNNSRLFSNIWEDYIGPAFESRYPAYQNMLGQNILWYLLRVMRCDKFMRSTSIISFVTTHIKNNVWELDDWLKEVRGSLTWWKAWAQHDAAPVGLTRERGEHICRRSSCCQMVPPMISTIESGQSGTHHWDWECYAFICVVVLYFGLSPSTFRFWYW